MNTSANKVIYSTIATKVIITNGDLVVSLEDGRKISVPVHHFTRLENATEQQRSKYKICYGGKTIRGEEIDEDISVPRLLGVDED